ncbi:TetR/AcrR family transcriptional regulator [Kocuria sp. cx-455]|uniref:TetR/AcrR family transcriptional regulator n=1 Tax=unclassified Candidatus Sulfotelmatobacter TaxID=2635724 RepID=UPI00168A287F|nr:MULTISPECIES: TetR/AcrR family transcriptional regulator [unclassified Candidatus Sulfotelmatobacter]MBD2763174.1 TetR/AcrR family transcriptional regulator [Kocuria sp. cx-116]MBD2765847.1 TetR/AcrR family transcriptional regulator [Kocuria sp. cx-455]
MSSASSDAPLETSAPLPTEGMNGGRQWRRRARTRAKLLAAARKLVADRGLAAVTMADVSAAAELAAGTIYNYFPSLEDLLSTLIKGEIDSVGDRLDRVAEFTNDPAEIYAASLRLLVRHALTDPLWGRIYVKLGVAHPIVVEVLGPRCRRDLERGVKAGRLNVVDLDLAVVCTFGAQASAINMVNSGEGREELAEHFAENMLRMVGVSVEDAREVVSRPLPGLD